MARLTALTGRLTGDHHTTDALQLMLHLAALAEHLAHLRQAQQRLHQARAARKAADGRRRSEDHHSTLGSQGSPGWQSLRSRPPLGKQQPDSRNWECQRWFLGAIPGKERVERLAFGGKVDRPAGEPIKQLP